MASKNITIVSDADFDEKVLNSDQPVLVDFYADWCGPCKMIAPVLEEYSEKYQGKVKIAKIDVDQNVQTASKFGVRSIPTLILFDNGQQKETIIGADPLKIQDVLEQAA
ncbi:MAG: thioredoxin [Proteobacteria bacterium]|nr:thioredoxin [Pseudomonadota bacterium]